MAKKTKKITKKVDSKMALVPVQVNLTPNQLSIISTPTPTQFIRTRPGPRGTQLTYVEGGYMINKLNEAFGPLNWSFEIVRDETKEIGQRIHVRVHGKLIIHDHKNGYKVSKEQEGSAVMKTQDDEREYGDVYKAAATDALKKCASLFGIAQDVYWPPKDEGEAVIRSQPAKQTIKYEDAIAQTRKMIEAAKSVAYLINLDEKIQQSKFKDKDKEELSLLAHKKADKLQG